MAGIVTLWKTVAAISRVRRHKRTPTISTEESSWTSAIGRPATLMEVFFINVIRATIVSENSWKLFSGNEPDEIFMV